MTVVDMCRAAEVSRAGFYRHRNEPSREDRDMEIDELHRPGKAGDDVRDPQLDVVVSRGRLLDHDRVVDHVVREHRSSDLGHNPPPS